MGDRRPEAECASWRHPRRRVTETAMRRGEGKVGAFRQDKLGRSCSLPPREGAPGDSSLLGTAIGGR